MGALYQIHEDEQDIHTTSLKHAPCCGLQGNPHHQHSVMPGRLASHDALRMPLVQNFEACAGADPVGAGLQQITRRLPISDPT